MTVTLDWFVKQSHLNNLRFITGENHARQEIHSVNILDNPDVLKWFKKDELILTTGYIFKDNPKLQRSIIREMKEIGCAALGVKIKRFFKTIPEDLIDEAHKQDFPVIELPFFYGFSEISQTVYSEIYMQQKQQPQKEQEFLLQLMDAFFQHESLPALLQHLAAFFAAPVLLTDICYSPLAKALPAAANDERLQKYLAAISAQLINQGESSPVCNIRIENDIWCLQPLPLANHMGYLCLIYEGKDLPVIPTEFLQKITQIIALACEQSDIAHLNPENHLPFFLHFLMHRKQADLEETKNLCAFYGFDYQKAWICTTFSLRSFPADQKKLIITQLRTIAHNVIPENTSIFICYNDNLFCIFFLFKPDCHRLQALHEVQIIIAAFHERLVTNSSITVPIGISGCHTNVQDIRQSFEESLQALNLQQQLDSSDPASYLHQLPCHLLMQYGKNTNCILRHNVLKPLLDFDKSSHTELTKTLQAYFLCNYNASATAKQLYLHRNTMLNRLEKIKELLQIDFTNTEENFLLYLSLITMKLDT